MCGGVTLSGCQVCTKATPARQGREDVTKGLWVVTIRMVRDHRLNLGKMNSIYLPVKSE